ncbi:hypothetical protein [Rhodopirellula baltica]
MKRKASVRNWLETIATKANVEVTDVESVLAKHRIEPMPVAASPTHLLINRIQFAGTKTLDGKELPVEFEWDELAPGLWAVLSNKNLRGKSTIVEVIRGCLRGSLSKTLQQDVNGWLQQVEMDFSLDDRQFKLTVDRSESALGNLSLVMKNGVLRKVFEFNDEDEFEAAMSNFFMKQFSFDQFAVSRKQNDVTSTVLHGWSAMCSALFIRTNYATIIGELPPTSGVPVRLLQLFLGIPWATTLASASSAFKEEERREAATGQRFNEAKELIQGRMDDLKAELAEKKTQLEKTIVSKSLQSELTNCQESIQAAIGRESQVRTDLRAANEDLEEAKASVNDDCSELRRHEEGSSAQTVFRALDPKACPRCETSITAKKKSMEQSTNACAVCGEAVHADVDEAEVKRRLEARLKASRKGQQSASKRVKQLNAELVAIREEISSTTAKQQKLAKRLSRPTKRTTLLAEVAGLEARIDELSKTIPSAPEVTTDTALLKVIEAITRGLMKDHQDDLLRAVSDKICEYANRFGILQLTETKLDGGLSLRIVKGGQPSSYSRVTPGEQLRLKVATVLAMIAVGQERGIGRFPGLLVLDSPASQEVTEGDLKQIMSGVAEIAETISHLQVFVASTASAAITDHIPASRRKEAVGSDYLW